jgi:class 3 adenylate cyclase
MAATPRAAEPAGDPAAAAAGESYATHRAALHFTDAAVEARYCDLHYVQSGFVGGRIVMAQMALVFYPLSYLMFQGQHGFWAAIQDPQPYVFSDPAWIIVHVTWALTLAGLGALMHPATAPHRELIFLGSMSTFFPCWIPLFLAVRTPNVFAYNYMIAIFFFFAAAQIRLCRLGPWIAVTAGVGLIATVTVVDPAYFVARSPLEVLFWPLTLFVFPLMALLETHSRRAFVERERALAAIAASEHKRAVTQGVIAGFFPATPTRDLLRTVGGPRSIAYPAAVMVVTDIVQFTAYTSRTDPTAVIAMLTELFHAIDVAAPAYAVEKVSTVGDSYCGAVFPQLPGDNAAAAADTLPGGKYAAADAAARCTGAVVFATQIVHFAEGLEMRVGVHVGDVVGGFVGCAPPKFDLFGAAMDHARRMEESGAPARVHVSAAVVDAIGENGRPRDAVPSELGVLCAGWEELGADVMGVTAGDDDGDDAAAHATTVVASIVHFARAADAADVSAQSECTDDAASASGSGGSGGGGGSGKYKFHLVLLEFGERRIERQFARYIRQCGINDAAAKLFLVMELYVLGLHEVFGCFVDRDRYATAAIVALITAMATSIGHFGTQHRFHGHVTCAIYTAVYVVAFLALTTDCGGLRRAMYVGNVAFMYFCLAFLATQFVFDIALKFRVAQLAGVCGLGVACFAVRAATVGDGMLPIDPAPVLPFMAFATISYFVEFSLRTSFAVVSELEDRQKEAQGRSARMAATAMSVMLPTFVTERIVDEARRAEAARRFGRDEQLSSSKSGEGSFNAGASSASSVVGVDIDFNDISVTWDFPHVVVLFASFAAEGLSHDTIDRTVQDMEAAAARHGILKVKTMGSTMLCVAGIDGGLSRAEAVATVIDAAREMRRVVLEPLAAAVAGLRFAVGVNSGPCFGAVIGGNGAIFDVFGDTVNTASRMMSTATHGAIQLSAAAHAALPTDPRRLRCSVVALDPVAVKGKGILHVFAVVEL